MRKCLFVFVLFFSFQLNHSQSYNTVTFNGDVSVFNDAERKWVGNGTRYFITYDENYIYALANRNSNSFWKYDHFTIYFDTDPQSGCDQSGNGSTSGVNWDGNSPTLPIKADYRVAIRRNNSESWLHHYNGSSWVDQSVDYTE